MEPRALRTLCAYMWHRATKIYCSSPLILRASPLSSKSLGRPSVLLLTIFVSQLWHSFELAQLCSVWIAFVSIGSHKREEDASCLWCGLLWPVSSLGKCKVHKLMDAMCSFLRGRGLTPHRIRAERSANVSALKLRGAGLTPQFHAERSTNTSLRARIILARFGKLGPNIYVATLLPQVRQPGPTMRTRSCVEGVVKLVFGLPLLFFCPCRLRPRLTCVSHVSDKQPGSGKGQPSGSVLWVRFVRPAWWQTTQSCPVPLDPGPGVRNQLHRERALRSGRRSEARIEGKSQDASETEVRRVQVRVQFFHAWRVPGTPKPTRPFLGEVAEL